MKKIKFLLSVFLFCAIKLNAQMEAGATIGLQVPMGKFGNENKAGFGLNAVGKYALKENVKAGANLGFNAFGSTKENFSYAIIPINGLVEYYFSTEELKPYVGMDIGFFLYTYKYEYTIFGQITKNSGSKMYFGFAPTVGVTYEMDDNLAICTNVKYNYIMTAFYDFTYLGINVGLLFKIDN